MAKSMFLKYGLILGCCLIAGCSSEESKDEAVDKQDPSTPGTPAPSGICEGSHFVYFAGGSEDDTFAQILSNGATAAAASVGATIEFVNSDWASDKMVDQLEDVIAKKPDGIALLGHAAKWATPENQKRYVQLIDQAAKSGILITSQNVAMSDPEAKYQANGFGFVGQDGYGAGAALANETVRRYNLKAGDKVWVWAPSLAEDGQDKGRPDGVYEAFEEAGMDVTYTKIEDAESQDPTRGTAIVADYLKENPDVKVICADSGPLTEHMETYLTSAGKGPDDIYVVGFDLSPKTAEELLDGWVDLVQDQQPFLQGYLPVVQLCLTQKFAFGGLHIDTGAGFIDTKNIETVIPLVEQFIR